MADVLLFLAIVALGIVAGIRIGIAIAIARRVNRLDDGLADELYAIDVDRGEIR